MYRTVPRTNQREAILNVIGISGSHPSVPFQKSRFPDLTPRECRMCQGFDSAAASEERFTR